MPRIAPLPFAAALALFVTLPLAAQAQQWPFGYGAGVSLESARKVAAGAAAEARKNGWKMAIAIVDPGGVLVYYEKLDDTQNGSAATAVDKARSAALYRRPTKSFEDAVKGGNLQLMMLPGAMAVEGALPLVVDGKIVGAVGVSGASSAQDGQCAKAGHEALAPVPTPAAPAPAPSPAPAAAPSPKK